MVRKIQAKIANKNPPIPSPESTASISEKSIPFDKSGKYFVFILSTKSFELSFKVIPLYNPNVINRKKNIDKIVVESNELKKTVLLLPIPKSQTPSIVANTTISDTKKIHLLSNGKLYLFLSLFCSKN